MVYKFFYKISSLFLVSMSGPHLPVFRCHSFFYVYDVVAIGDVTADDVVSAEKVVATDNIVVIVLMRVL